MKINTIQPLKALGEETLKDEGGQPILLKSPCVNALLAALPGDESATGMQLIERITLAERIFAGDEVELTPEQIKLIVDRAISCYRKTFPILAARVVQALDPRNLTT